MCGNKTKPYLFNFPCLRGKAAGFTLIELMVTLSIAVILATVAAPSFRGIIANQRIHAAGSELNADLMLARSEAIKRNSDVVVQRVGEQWENGWQMLAGTPATILKEQSAYPNLSIASTVANVTYNRNGRVAAAGDVNFTISDPSVTSSQPRCVTVTLTGMPIIRKGAC